MDMLKSMYPTPEILGFYSSECSFKSALPAIPYPITAMKRKPKFEIGEIVVFRWLGDGPGDPLYTLGPGWAVKEGELGVVVSPHKGVRVGVGCVMISRSPPRSGPQSWFKWRFEAPSSQLTLDI